MKRNHKEINVLYLLSLQVYTIAGSWPPKQGMVMQRIKEAECWHHVTDMLSSSKGANGSTKMVVSDMVE